MSSKFVINIHKLLPVRVFSSVNSLHTIVRSLHTIVCRLYMLVCITSVVPA